MKKIIKYFEPFFLTAEEKEPCSRCSGRMRYLYHQDSSMSAESKFECDDCKLQEYRGGTGSELWFEKLHEGRKKFLWLRRY
jgi:hypothetical protein